MSTIHTVRRPGPRLTVGLLLLPVVAVGLPLLLRGMTYRGAVGWAAGLPEPVAAGVAAVADGGLVLLGLVYLAVLAARRSDRLRLLVGLVAGAAAVIAYATSEVVKSLVAQRRPCQDLAVETVVSCPTDHSWPSNHATIAAALATAVVLLAPRLWRVVVPLALAVATARVLVGVHYVHDATAGLLLGAAVVASLTLGAGPTLLDRLPRRLVR